MKDEYIIINKTAIQKRKEEYLNDAERLNNANETELADIQIAKANEIDCFLSQSTPLIPEIEKAFDSSWFKAHGVMANKEKEKQDYISNLKLDI